MTLYNQLVGVELSSYDLDLSDERDVTSVAIFQEDLNHFKDYRYPRALEVLGVNFKSKSWGMLALSAPEYIERRRLHFYPSVIDDKDFWDNWGFNIGKIQRLGRRSMDAVLNYRSLLNPQKRGNLHLYGEYITSFDDEKRVAAIVEKSNLRLLFLSFPGQLLRKERISEAFELLMGCLALDNELNLQPLSFVLTRLLYLAHMPDVDASYETDPYGTASVDTVLNEYGVDTEKDLVFVNTDVEKPPSFYHRFLRESFLFGTKVAEGYGHNDPAAASANRDDLRSSPLVITYCQELRGFYLSAVSKCIFSEINLSSVYPVERYLRDYYKCTEEEFDEYFDCYELEVIWRKSSVGIPILIRPHLCLLVVDEKVVSVGISVTPERSQMVAMRRLVVSLREQIPMDKILSKDPAVNQKEVYHIIAEYYPHVPYKLEIIRPYVL